MREKQDVEAGTIEFDLLLHCPSILMGLLSTPLAASPSLTNGSPNAIGKLAGHNGVLCLYLVALLRHLYVSAVVYVARYVSIWRLFRCLCLFCSLSVYCMCRSLYYRAYLYRCLKLPKTPVGLIKATAEGSTFKTGTFAASLTSSEVNVTDLRGNQDLGEGSCPTGRLPFQSSVKTRVYFPFFLLVCLLNCCWKGGDWRRLVLPSQEAI